MANQNRQVLLRQRPKGMPTTADFEIADMPLPDPAEGEVLVRAIYLSLDPYMRGRISGAPPLPRWSTSAPLWRAGWSAKSSTRRDSSSAPATAFIAWIWLAVPPFLFLGKA